MESQEEPTVLCDNCGKSIAESKSFTHEAYCFRNIIRCPKCDEPINKNEVDIHEKEVHKLMPCRYCRRDFEASIISAHVDTCPQKPKLCPFCNCDVSNDEYTDHLYQCGSRTRKCSFCSKSILVRDLEAHENTCQIEQFTRGTLNTGNIEENKAELLEDMFSRPKKREPLPDTRHIYKKKLDGYMKDLTRKRLAKLSDTQTPASNEDRNLEEEDEQLAREMNKEYYEGRKPGEQNNNIRTRLRNQREEPNERETNRRENNENRRAAKQQAGNKIKAHLSNEGLGEDNEEEFYGFKRTGGRGGMEIEKEGKKTPIEEEDDEAYARKLQNEFDRKPTTQKAQTVEEPQYEEEEYYNPEEEVFETPQAEPQKFEDFAYRGRRKKPDTALPQYLQDEDAELQRAIQASLEHQ